MPINRGYNSREIQQRKIVKIVHNYNYIVFYGRKSKIKDVFAEYLFIEKNTFLWMMQQIYWQIKAGNLLHL